eukprot:CAMPEP_0179963654 /NCGR_PEP_ID=MMETSP0983-20121128/30896_1 /TAXON_ID=483367 /ORGANISM="non described non described, Strain CCMP 2436" /LENGTH=156 /DNA_ID=CAMNT_0021876299 /DNA_START=20 /DNA_END=487 /DNA_ORIENTATION=-
MRLLASSAVRPTRGMRRPRAPLPSATISAGVCPRTTTRLRASTVTRPSRGTCLSGMFHAHGMGVPQDVGEAARLYRLAADQGVSRAQGNLAVFHEQGKGVPQDVGEAGLLYRLAADQGNAYAQGNLALMYPFGRGVPRDEVEATRYYRLAAEQGNV